MISPFDVFNIYVLGTLLVIRERKEGKFCAVGNVRSVRIIVTYSYFHRNCVTFVLIWKIIYS